VNEYQRGYHDGLMRGTAIIHAFVKRNIMDPFYDLRWGDLLTLSNQCRLESENPPAGVRAERKE